MERLSQWAKDYFTYLKSAMGKAYEILEVNGRLELRHADYSEEIICMEKLKKPTKANHQIIITMNTKQNLSTLIKDWKSFCIPNLKLYFVNPSKPLLKLVLSPFVHDKVCEPKNLARSLKSMIKAAFETSK